MFQYKQFNLTTRDCIYKHNTSEDFFRKTEAPSGTAHKALRAYISASRQV